MDSGIPSRRWEFLYRLIPAAAARVLSDKRVADRRSKAGVTANPAMHRFGWEDAIAEAPEAIPAVPAAVAAWIELFDAWWDSRNSDGSHAYVFPDIYAVGYFATLLEADDTVFFRGEKDARWRLESTLSRKQRDRVALETAKRGDADFADTVNRDPVVRALYDGNNVPGWHMDALRQHYGFPTHYLDFTTEFEVAAFFAEGGSDDVAPLDEKQPVEIGAIYAFPAITLPLESSRLVVLPPCFPRPRLQRGVFIYGDPDVIDLGSFAETKFLFRQSRFPQRNGIGRLTWFPQRYGIGRLTWGKSPGLTEFYFPENDRFGQLALELQGRAGVEQGRDWWYKHWVRETYDMCFHDRQPGLQWVNDHHLRLRCKSEPVLAYRTFIQFLNDVAHEVSQRQVPRNCAELFILRSWSSALLFDGVLPGRMREQTVAACEQHAALLSP